MLKLESKAEVPNTTCTIYHHKLWGSLIHNNSIVYLKSWELSTNS